MDKNYIIETKNLTKQYGSQKSVADLNIHVQKGRIYGLLGRNGAGKTTTMKMLLGLTKPTSGEVKIWGKSLQGNEKKLLPRIGSLIESPGFYPNLTATENLQIFATLRGIPNRHSIKNTLDLVGLPYKDKKLFSQYSLGMKQRLAIALAVMHDPELLILDEPINGLDPIGIAEVRSFIRELCDTMMLGYGLVFLLPCLIGIIAAILFFIERDCDTSKNLRTIPVTNTQLIMAKISMLFIFSVAFCLISTLSVALFCKLFHVGMVYGMTYKIFMSLIFGVLIVAASLPIVFLIIYFNKSFLLSILLAFFYSIFNWGILGTIGTSISAAKIAFLNSFPVICVMNWTSGLMMDNLQKDNLLPEAYAIVPTTFHTIFIMAITVVLSLWLIIRFYKKWTR